MSLAFLKRVAEEAVYAFVAAVSAGILAGGDLGKASAVAGLVAGGRAVLGVLVKNFGSDTERPSVQ